MLHALWLPEIAIRQGQVMEQFDVTREQIAAVLDFVAQSLKVSAPAEASAPVAGDC